MTSGGITVGAGPWVLAIAMIAVFALLWGGSRLIRGRTDRNKGWLMIVAAAVLLANVAILTL
ncbi:hypothetical protein D3Y57_18510 [Sphingomonas paeninsulae]|jgi:hypothetical protein|uniref:Uncharacterized protein n=1 Tax=Sphingomonas paeninsulae TaxID=2319844 RepID=A0A494TKH4_SPHPE|nr:hypothetical protein [Sphingomonas paeninsulae]AYJ87543.1 hypothetical protein D3Y57_18510 [Sphingomonas paeninsulae]